MVYRNIRIALALRLNRNEPVARIGVGAAASDRLAGEAGEGADFAEDVCGVLARQLEGDALDARVVLAQGVVGDIDVFVLGGVAGSAAVCWVGAVGGLGRGGCDRSGGEEGCDGEELHGDGVVVDGDVAG